MTETENALSMQALCAFSRWVLIQTNPTVSKIVAVLFNRALTVGSASVKVIFSNQPISQRSKTSGNNRAGR